jgi:hypothetical protein
MASEDITQHEIDEVNTKYPGLCFYKAMTEREKQIKNHYVGQHFAALPGDGDKPEFVTFVKGLHEHIIAEERKQGGKNASRKTA